MEKNVINETGTLLPNCLDTNSEQKPDKYIYKDNHQLIKTVLKVNHVQCMPALDSETNVNAEGVHFFLRSRMHYTYIYLV